MNKWLVITTINPPTKAIAKIVELVAHLGWRCVVVGDRKTPADWHAAGIDFLSYDDQFARFGDLARVLPSNHYCRKNLGYLHAMAAGAELILETDDDNIPTDRFGLDIARQVTSTCVGDTRWANVYGHFSDTLIWPRGNPLDTIHEAGHVLGEVTIDAPIQQFLADGDPDVDAIYRLLYKQPLYFKQRSPISLHSGTWCAFNSQNTVFFADAFPLLYLPCHVSFRMTDIWRSFVAQAALWTQDKQIVFRSATVVQERNAHNLMKDFRDEVDGYLRNDEIIYCLSQVVEKMKGQTDLTAFVRAAWLALLELGVIREVEIDILDSWTEACRAALSTR